MPVQNIPNIKIMKRNIIKIDEEKCNGCGACIPDCPEGALKIVNGKVRLVKESLCDGLGACVGKCPVGALIVETREADEFDEAAAEQNMESARKKQAQESLPCGCPGTMVKSWDLAKEIKGAEITEEISINKDAARSALRQWPVQLHLLNPRAPYFQNADLLIAADCVAFSFANFHQRFLRERRLIIFCPKLDHALESYIEKLADILRFNDIKSVTVVHMEVPCCAGTVSLTEEAIRRSRKNLVIRDYVISLQGEIV